LSSCTNECGAMERVEFCKSRYDIDGTLVWFTEALFTDKTVQNYPLNYNYSNEQNRFEEAGKLWKQAAPPYSDKWNAVMKELLDLDFTLDPTFNIYDASRDLMRARRAEWHEDYTLPSLWKFYEPSRNSHGSYWFNWGTEQELAWKENYKLG
jgi:hypothetical protein